VNSSGYPLQPAITIPPDALSITIGVDGTVSVTQPNNPSSTQIGNIQLADFINAAGLQSEGNNLYVETSASGPPSVNDPGTNGLGTLEQGYVETSNVSVTEELVNLITAQRAFEINSRAVRTSDEMLARLAQL
jgi:flagellar basal-body rod protein FlgG